MSRDMKDSGVEWIGDIPKGWGFAKMNFICNTITDYVASGSFAALNKNVKYLDEPDYAMLIRTVDLSKNQNKKNVYINEHAYNFLANSNLFGGEIILPNVGAVGDVYIVPKLYERMSLAPNSIMIKTNYCDNYYYYLFLCDVGKQSLLKISGNVAQPKFNKTDFRQLKFPLPSIEEQERIVHFLDEKVEEIDKLIDNTKQSIEEYKKYKQSIITEAVTKGLDQNVEIKDTEYKYIGQIPIHWQVKKIKYVLKETGERTKNGSEEPLSMSQKYGLIPTKEMDIIPNVASSFKNCKIVHKNDLVFNKLKAHLGVFAKSNYDGIVSPDYSVYQSKFNDNMLFLEYLFKTPQYISQFIKHSRGIAQGLTRLYTEELFNIFIAMPSINEQDQITKYLRCKSSEIDSLILKKQQLILELESYKKSLIYEYVTGKKEV